MTRGWKVVVMFVALGCLGYSSLWAEPVEKIDARERCAVCGMFVAKYDNWITQMRYGADTVVMFDGVKDMMAYYFAPESFGGSKGALPLEMFVKDYYTLKWTDARKAFYVLGSDVVGPMGHELVPFATRAAAENFMNDHHGKTIVDFAAITAEKIDGMRAGHTMKMKKAMKMQGN